MVFQKILRNARESRSSLGAELRHALSRNEIFVLFQPIVRLEDRTVAGFEASPRWRHPRLGVMSPAEFLRDPEGAVAMAEIGAFVLDYAARELAAWQKGLDVNPPIFTLLGLFSRQMLAHDLLGDLRSALGRHAIARGSLKLGVGESLVMENPEFVAQLLPRARELGRGWRSTISAPATPRSARSNAISSTRCRSAPRSPSPAAARAVLRRCGR